MASHQTSYSVVALISADTAARASQLFHGIAHAAEVLTRGRPSLFGVPFHVVSARNTEHSEEGNGRPRCRSATLKAVSDARWGDFTGRKLSSNKLSETSTTVRLNILFPAYFKWRRAVELNHPRLLLRGPLMLAPFLDLLDSCNYVLKRKLNVVALMSADTAARAGQLFHVITREAEMLTHGHPLLFGVPFCVVIARNTEHSEEGNGRPRCR
ncbi:hypothetical protein NDU88_004488 [Pleurodeles waltl]|uniref:Uncharacterized protein n=1 Tax=Pleurodeles waltl TaxID=8319 RepID=A0AAV7SIX7_PLEWA|nr:hypothetical protein NDU88_004488 [Pleurodeles waltl]